MIKTAITYFIIDFCISNVFSLIEKNMRNAVLVTHLVPVHFGLETFTVEQQVNRLRDMQIIYNPLDTYVWDSQWAVKILESTPSQLSIARNEKLRDIAVIQQRMLDAKNPSMRMSRSSLERVN